MLGTGPYQQSSLTPPRNHVLDTITVYQRRATRYAQNSMHSTHACKHESMAYSCTQLTPLMTAASHWWQRS